MSHSTPLPEDAVIIAGGRGYLGSALLKALSARGQTCLVLSRRGGGLHAGAQVLCYEDLARISGCRGVINLAGADIAGGRWTQARRQELRDSRLQTTERLCNWVRGLPATPEFFMSASAIGYYGPGGEQPADESSPGGDGFAAQLCRDWEQTVQVPDDCRVLSPRIGVVLGAGGGALRRMLPAFRLGLGGRIGDGSQWMSWIALDDLVKLLLTAMDDSAYVGAFNAVAPSCVRNQDFARTLAEVLHRPALLPMPAGLLRLVLGEMSSLLLDSQRIVSSRLPALGFAFDYPELHAALVHAVNPSARAD